MQAIGGGGAAGAVMAKNNKTRVRKINPEWWLVLSLFGVSGLVSIIPFPSHMLLFLYLAPVMIAAFLYGRKMGMLTAIACVLLVLTGSVLRDVFLDPEMKVAFATRKWEELITWAVLLIGFGWGLGWLFGDFRQTHEGFVDIMRYMVGRDNDRHNYVRRISYVAGVVAQEMGLTPVQCETIRRAALLRDIGELELSRDTFKRFSTICQSGELIGGFGLEQVKLGDVMDLVLAQRIYGSQRDRYPLGARILLLATAYDDLTSSKKRRSALPPSVARAMIERESGKRFDAVIVRAFSRACNRGAFSPTGQDFIAAAGD